MEADAQESSIIGVKEIMKVLRVCESTARNIIKSEGFPAIPIGKTRLRVPREAFFAWLNDPDKINTYKDRQNANQ